MSKFKFPRNPGTERADPFTDEQGRNPFADEGNLPAADANPYGASDGSRPYQPGDYEAMLPDRSRRVLTFGIAGLVLAALGILGAAVGLVTAQSWGWGLALGMPIQLLGLAASLPAWIMGAADRRAIRAGAMHEAGLRRTSLALWLGIAGVLTGAVPVVVWLGLLIAALWAG